MLEVFEIKYNSKFDSPSSIFRMISRDFFHYYRPQNYEKKIGKDRIFADMLSARADNEPNQLENNSILDSINDSLNLVHEPNEPNLS
jgi:hypothetical protein